MSETWKAAAIPTREDHSGLPGETIGKRSFASGSSAPVRSYGEHGQSATQDDI
jgi:hypothetical protein